MDQLVKRSETAGAPGAKPAHAAMIFARDRESEGVIRQCLSDLNVADVEFFSGSGITEAIATLKRRSSPRLLIVDVSGANDPVSRIAELADVCEPGVGVVVIGENNDIALYRSLRRTGIVDYFFKPLVRDLVTHTFKGIISGSVEQKGTRTGKLVFVLSIRGGAGATTIAVNSAWHLAEARQRKVLLVDLDLQFGDAALQLDVTPSHALREALEHPERVDDLFLERGVTHVTERLDVLAALEPVKDGLIPEEDAVLSLLENLLHRYRYVFVDVPTTLAPKLMRVLSLPSTCLLVGTGSLVSARDTARWLEQIGPNTPERSTIHVLNKSGAHGTLPEAELVRAIGRAPDVVIPYSREIGVASNLGISAMQKSTLLQRGLAPVFRCLAGEAVVPPRSFLERIFK